MRLDNNILTKVHTLKLPYFEQLIVLDLSYNQIEDLPFHLSSMTGLKELYLNNNLLTQLPDMIGCLKDLEILDLSFNRIKNVSTEIRHLVNLHHLDLRHNQLQCLPHSIGCLEAKLFTILVDDNPFEPTFYSLIEPILCEKPNSNTLGSRTRSSDNVKTNRWQMIRKAVRKGLHTNFPDSPRSPLSPSIPIDSPLKTSFDFSQIGTQLRKISISGASSGSSFHSEEKSPTFKIEPKFSHKIKQLGHSLSSGNLRSNFNSTSPPAIPAKNPNRTPAKKTTVDSPTASTPNFDNRKCHTMDGLIFMTPGSNSNSAPDYLSSRSLSRKSQLGGSPPEFSPTTPELLHRTSHSSELTHTSRSSYDSTSPHESFGDSNSMPFPLSSSQSAPPPHNPSSDSLQYSPSHIPPSHQWLKLPVNLPASNVVLSVLRQLVDIWDLNPISSENDLIRNKRRTAKTNTVVSTDDEIESPNPSSKHDEKRRINIMKEILATEETYVESLQGVVDIYIKPAQEKHIFSPDEMRIMFSKIESVLSLHSQVFLPEFRSAMRQPDPPIGQVFQSYTAFMKMYSMYVNDFDQSNLEVEKQQTLGKTKKKIKQYFDNAKLHPKHNQLNLQGYLLLPVQRIPRYKLLLQDLLKFTDEAHSDYIHLKFALQEISKLADEINERKRDKESHDKVLSIQNRIKSNVNDIGLVEPHRRFILEGSLYLTKSVSLKTRNISNISQPTAASVPSSPMTSTHAQPHSARISTPIAKSQTSPLFSYHSFSMGYVVRDANNQQQTNRNSDHHSISSLPSHSLHTTLIEQTFTFVLFNDIMIMCRAYPNGQLELAKILQLGSRLCPAKLTGDNELRVVDDSKIYYFNGEKETLIKWAQAINGRY